MTVITFAAKCIHASGVKIHLLGLSERSLPMFSQVVSQNYHKRWIFFLSADETNGDDADPDN